MIKKLKSVTKLLAVIDGYNEIKAQNKQKTLEFSHIARKIMKPLIEQHNGIWMHERDGKIYINFTAPEDAVNYSVAVQQALQNESELTLRIGIHTVDFKTGIMTGDVVASGITEMTLSGGVSISDNVYGAIQDRTDIKAEFLKDMKPEGVERTIRVYALSGEGLAEPVTTTSTDIQTTRAKTKPSIAVLPFIDMSPEKDQEYFCDGIAETIIDALTHVEDLHVVARTSAFYFKGKDVKINDIGKELNVETIMEGSIQKAGNRLRISTQLVNVSDGYHLWSEKYDRNLDDIFAIQDEISLAIVEALQVKLLKKEKEAIEKRYTENIEAYDLYLRVKYILDMVSYERLPQKDQDELAQARAEGEDYLKILYQKIFDYINQALLIDPHFAQAHVMRSHLYMYIAWTGYVKPKEGWTKAREEAVKALQIDHSLAEAHVALATISFFHDWDWPAVERGLQQAFKLNPNVIYANITYSEYLVTKGDFNNALTYAKKALALDPLNIDSYALVMTDLYCMGRYDEVIEHFNEAIDINPNNQLAYRVIGHLYLRQGKFKKALEAFENIREIMGEWIVTDEWIAFTYTRLGENEKAEQILNKWLHESREKYVPSMPLASMYIGLGDYDNAFKQLDIAFKEHDSHLVCITYWPDFDPIRSDPRFMALLKKMGLPED